MNILLTPEMLAAAYDYLCCHPPFSKMNMPHSEDIRFSVINKTDRFAHYQLVDDVHTIAVSKRFVGRHIMLLATLAHEAAHLYMQQNCIVGRDAHGKGFQKLADRICKHHPEFDRLNF